MLAERTDGELIRLYLDQSNYDAFETLLRRYYDDVFGRFLTRSGRREDAEDLTQQLWIRVLENLESYTDHGKFPAFLSTIATNLLTDYWRRSGVRSRVAVGWDETVGREPADPGVGKEVDTELLVETQEAIDYLVRELIPALPCPLRMVYLLRHESEYWDGKRRLEWHHLAELNGITVPRAWERFESARESLLRLPGAQSGGGAAGPDCEDLLIFLVWTQSQRPFKNQKFTERKIAELLGISVNTVKTRYRAASKLLADGLDAWRG